MENENDPSYSPMNMMVFEKSAETNNSSNCWYHGLRKNHWVVRKVKKT